MINRRTMRVDRASNGEGIPAQIREVVTALQPQFQWRAVGVGDGGPVDHGTGRICTSYHVAGWNQFPLGDWVRKLTGLPVAVENDTNVAAYGEAHRGADVGADPVFCTNSGSGVGGGLVVGGKLYHGVNEIVLPCADVPQPVAVCYGWSNDPADRNLYNRENLPATPFRTDNW